MWSQSSIFHNSPSLLWIVKGCAVFEITLPSDFNNLFFPQCDLVLDAAHRKSPEPSIGPRKEDIVESIIFKASDVVVVTFKDVDLNFARKGTEHILYYQVVQYYYGAQQSVYT